MGEKVTHPFVLSDLPTMGGCCHSCGRQAPHPEHEPNVAVAQESRSLERDTPVAERGRAQNHSKGRGYVDVGGEPDTRAASSREGGSIPPSDTYPEPEPAPERRCSCPVPDCQHHRGLAPWPEPLRKLVDEFWPTLCPGGRGHYADHARACSECWTRLLERVVRETVAAASRVHLEAHQVHTHPDASKGGPAYHSFTKGMCEGAHQAVEAVLHRWGLSESDESRGRP